VQDEEDVLDIIHNNPSTSTHHISSAKEQLLFVRMHEGKSLCYGSSGLRLINRTEVAAVDIIPRQLVSIRGSIRCRCEACVQVEGRHFEHLF
jgi:hypothetical protein